MLHGQSIQTPLCIMSESGLCFLRQHRRCGQSGALFELPFTSSTSAWVLEGRRCASRIPLKKIHTWGDPQLIQTPVPSCFFMPCSPKISAMVGISTIQPSTCTNLAGLASCRQRRSPHRRLHRSRQSIPCDFQTRELSWDLPCLLRYAGTGRDAAKGSNGPGG